MTTPQLHHTKPCTACSELINYTATICKTCKTHQGWKKHIPTSSSMLALIVAALSIITVLANSLGGHFQSSRITLVPRLTPTPSIDLLHDTNIGDLRKRSIAYKISVPFACLNSGAIAGAITSAEIEASINNHAIRLDYTPPPEAAVLHAESLSIQEFIFNFRAEDIGLPSEYIYSFGDTAEPIQLQMSPARVTVNTLSSSGRSAARVFAYDSSTTTVHPLGRKATTTNISPAPESAINDLQ